jgi:hypothetical protein
LSRADGHAYSIGEPTFPDISHPATASITCRSRPTNPCAVKASHAGPRGVPMPTTRRTGTTPSYRFSP